MPRQALDLDQARDVSGLVGPKCHHLPIRVIDGKADAPPATYEQIVVFEFGDVKRLKRMSKEERIASLHAMATRIY
jgi:hypothetical protein